MYRLLLWFSVALIVCGVAWFALSLPQAGPLVDWLWTANDAFYPLWVAMAVPVSTVVENLWTGWLALPAPLKMAFAGLILLTVFALLRYLRSLGRPLVDLVPRPLRWPLLGLAAMLSGIGFVLRHRLAATAFLMLTFLMIIYFGAAIVSNYSSAFAALGTMPGLNLFVPVATPTATAAPTPTPRLPRELWDDAYTTAQNRGTAPTELAVRQAIAARDAALVNFRHWLRGEVNWSSAELRLKVNDADAARTYFFQQVGAYPESAWPPRVQEIRAQLDHQVQYLNGLLDVMQKAEAKDWNGALSAAGALDRLSSQNMRAEIEGSLERARRTPTPTATPLVQIIVLPSPTPTHTPTIIPTPTQSPATRWIPRLKEAVGAGEWPLAEFLVEELNLMLVPADTRRRDLANWLADQAEDPLLYAEPVGGSAATYRPSIGDLCRSSRLVRMALVLDGSHPKATRLEARVTRWMAYYLTENGRDVRC